MEVKDEKQGGQEVREGELENGGRDRRMKEKRMGWSSNPSKGGWMWLVTHHISVNLNCSLIAFNSLYRRKNTM